MQLNTETLTTKFNTSSTTSYNYGGSHKLELPQLSVNVAKPLSYEFRVAEFTDSKGKISKVGLQVRIWEHSSINGFSSVIQAWKDVERVQIPKVD